MKKTVMITLLMLFTLITLSKGNDLAVEKVTLPEITWGEKYANLVVDNTTGNPKYLVVMTEVKINNNDAFSRSTRSNYFILPDQTANLSQKLLVPGSFGSGVIEFKFYDVIDTLDEILDYQLFDTKKLDFTFTLPEKLKKYTEFPVLFPPRVDEHPYFNDDFTKIFLAMCAEGQSITDINLATDTDVDFIINIANRLVERRLIKKGDNSYQLRFPFIKSAEAKDVYAIAEATSEKLAAAIEANMTGYWPKVDSLIEAKIIPRDSNDFLSGATLLYKPHPMVSVMLLWYSLGRKFITRSAPLLIYDGTDICNADIYQYMYAINADSQYYNDQFYYQFQSPSEYAMTYSRTKPDITCSGDFLMEKAHGKKPQWRYTHPVYPEFFIVDTVTANPFIDMLSQNTDQIITDAYNQLDKINLKYGRGRVDFGYRYWFWSLASNLTLEKLEAKGVIDKPENPYYRMDAINRR